MLKVSKNKASALYKKIIPKRSDHYKRAFLELRLNTYSLSRHRLLTKSRKIRRVSPYLVKEMTKCELLPYYSCLANSGFRLVMLIERAHCSKNEWYFQKEDIFIIYRQFRGGSNKQFILRKKNTVAKMIDISFDGKLLNSINAKSMLAHFYDLFTFKCSVIYSLEQISKTFAEYGYVFIDSNDNYDVYLYNKRNVYILLSPLGNFMLCLGKLPYCMNYEHFDKHENLIMIQLEINYDSTLPELIEIIKWLESFVDL